MHLPLIRLREQAALGALTAATGDTSLCAASRSGTSVPAVKYHEGAYSALADARRAVTAIADPPGGESSARSAVLEVRARWQAQVGTTGRAGPSWAGYLSGGLDALDRLLDDDGTPQP